jgi:nucleoside 2-deoxyribosyltransferase
MKSKLNLYFGAALFNARETLFNSILSDRLESDGYKVYLPQRDGFEFSSLRTELEKTMSPYDAERAMKVIIYLLDVGKGVFQSDVLVANLDEPIDEGLVVEMAWARLMGIPIVGFRTDVRSPYGELGESFRGTHFFPVFFCSFFVSSFIKAATPQKSGIEMDDFYKKICSAIERCPASKAKPQHPLVTALVARAQILFDGAEDISGTGLAEVVARFQKHPIILEHMMPEII